MAVWLLELWPLHLHSTEWTGGSNKEWHVPSISGPFPDVARPLPLPEHSHRAPLAAGERARKHSFSSGKPLAELKISSRRRREKGRTDGGVTRTLPPWPWLPRTRTLLGTDAQRRQTESVPRCSQEGQSFRRKPPVTAPSTAPAGSVQASQPAPHTLC